MYDDAIVIFAGATCIFGLIIASRRMTKALREGKVKFIGIVRRTKS